MISNWSWLTFYHIWLKNFFYCHTIFVHFYGIYVIFIVYLCSLVVLCSGILCIFSLIYMFVLPFGFHFQVFSWCHSFASRCRTPLSISYRASLVVMNSISIFLSGKGIIYPSFLKENFVRYNILGCHFFSSALWICHSILWSIRFLLRNPMFSDCGSLVSD